MKKRPLRSAEETQLPAQERGLRRKPTPGFQRPAPRRMSPPGRVARVQSPRRWGSWTAEGPFLGQL